MSRWQPPSSPGEQHPFRSGDTGRSTGISRSGLRGLSPAAVISTLALIIALGGTSYAAFSLPKNSVGPNQLENGAVAGPKIRNRAVTGSKIAKGAITGANVNLAALGTVPSANDAQHAARADNASNANHASSADSATSASNASHANTADMATNATVANALGGVQYVASSVSYVSAGHLGSGWVVCPPGLEVSGGGMEGNSGNTDESIQGSYPFKSGASSLPNAWRVYVNNTGVYTDGFKIYAICVPESSATSF